MSVVIDVAVLWALLVGINAPATLVGLDFEDDGRRLSREPPGWVIPVAWVVLVALLGVARSRVGGTPEAWAITGLALLCASYAWYTFGLSRLTGISPSWLGLVDNLAVVLAALGVAIVVGRVDRLAGWLVAPVASWTVFATALVVGRLRAGFHQRGTPQPRHP